MSKDVRGALKQNSTLPIQVEELLYRLLDFPTDWNPLAIAIWVRDAKDQTSWTMVHGERYCSPHLGNGFDECGAELSLDLPLLVQKVRHFAGQGTNTIFPVVFREASSSCALAAWAMGISASMRTSSSPLRTMSRTAPARARSSSRVAM